MDRLLMSTNPLIKRARWPCATLRAGLWKMGQTKEADRKKRSKRRDGGNKAHVEMKGTMLLWYERFKWIEEDSSGFLISLGLMLIEDLYGLFMKVWIDIYIFVRQWWIRGSLQSVGPILNHLESSKSPNFEIVENSYFWDRYASLLSKERILRLAKTWIVEHRA